jgi:hypothetical protein
MSFLATCSNSIAALTQEMDAMTFCRSLFTAGICVVAVVSVSLAGCGGSAPATYRAGGKVVFADGKPLTSGAVELRSMDGKQHVVARGQIQSDGSFRLSTFGPNDGAVEGEHAALVAVAPPEGNIGDMKVIPKIIDPRYSQFDTSGLKFTITRDPTKNQFTIQIDRPAKQ